MANRINLNKNSFIVILSYRVSPLFKTDESLGFLENWWNVVTSLNERKLTNNSHTCVGSQIHKPLALTQRDPIPPCDREHTQWYKKYWFGQSFNASECSVHFFLPTHRKTARFRSPNVSFLSLTPLVLPVPFLIQLIQRWGGQWQDFTTPRVPPSAEPSSRPSRGRRTWRRSRRASRCTLCSLCPVLYRFSSLPHVSSDPNPPTDYQFVANRRPMKISAGLLVGMEDFFPGAFSTDVLCSMSD